MSDDAQITRRQFNATVAAGAAYTALTPFEAAGASARASQTRAHQELILPVTQVEPFDVNTPYPTAISGTAMTTYIDSMRSCSYVTMMSNPAISVPAGFSASGLPVGVQIVGRHRDEWSVLQLAYAFEQATHHGRRRPALLA